MTEAPAEITFDVVVATDRERGIGKGGIMPWHLPGDLAHFKKLTSEPETPGVRNAVVMGRKTWQSIPDRFRPLPGRTNIVLTRQKELDLPDGVIRAGSLDEALAALAREHKDGRISRVFVIGGGQVFAEALDRAECAKLYVTRIDSVFGCDTFFPRFEDRYHLVAIAGENRDNDIVYRIEVWRCDGRAE